MFWWDFATLTNNALISECNVSLTKKNGFTNKFVLKKRQTVELKNDFFVPLFFIFFFTHVKIDSKRFGEKI